MSKHAWIPALLWLTLSACASSPTGKGPSDGGSTSGGASSGGGSIGSGGSSTSSGGSGGAACALPDGGLGLRCSGTCLDVESDPSHCGGCSRACAPGQLCRQAQCLVADCAGAAASAACALGDGGLGACCGSGCADLATDPANCGACGDGCATGQICANKSCLYSDCSASGASNQGCLLADAGAGSCCGGGCQDPSDFASDSANCGYCGNACGAGEVCTQSRCAFLACAAGDDNASCAFLDGGFGSCCKSACVNGGAYAADPANCGACGTVCASDQTCGGGQCLYTSCDGGAQAEGQGCTSGGTAGLCCGGACAQVASDSQNCGSCGFACPSKSVCQSSGCKLPAGGFDAGVPVYGFLDGGATVTVAAPAGASSVTLKVWGAGGGGLDNGPTQGGGGGYASQTFSVTAGEALTIQVGGAGANGGPYGQTSVPGGAGYGAGGGSPGQGWHGGGGGGASAVFAGSTLLVVAGGGGGAGGAIGYASGGAGGSADGLAGGTCGTPASHSAGAGGLSGDHGGKGGAGFPGSGLAGGDGSTAPGAGGAGGVCSSGDGLGGGGGGGYVGGGGGGGGGSCLGGGGGGGGSSYLSSTGATGQAISLAGNGADPGNSADPDLPPGAAEGGGGNLPSGDGAIVVIWH